MTIACQSVFPFPLGFLNLASSLGRSSAVCGRLESGYALTVTPSRAALARSPPAAPQTGVDGSATATGRGGKPHRPGTRHTPPLLDTVDSTPLDEVHEGGGVQSAVPISGT